MNIIKNTNSNTRKNTVKNTTYEKLNVNTVDVWSHLVRKQSTKEQTNTSTMLRIQNHQRLKKQQKNTHSKQHRKR